MKKIILTVVIFLCLITHVFATTIILPQPDQMINDSDIIVTGNVSEIVSFKTDQGIQTMIRIKVLDSIKGINDEYLEVREIGGKVGNEITWIAGSPTYKVGEKVTVLLKRLPDGSLRTHLLDNGRIPEKVGFTGSALFGTVPSFKEKVLSKIDQRRKELKQSYYRPLPLGSMVQPAPLSGPAESLTEFRFMTDPPSRWLDNPVKVYGDPLGDVKYGPAESQRSVKDATVSWSSAANVTFQYSGDTPAVGYTCVPDKLLVQFRDVASDIEDPKNCSGVLAIGGFCSGRMVDGKYDITGGAVVFNNGWENCSFWTPDNITEVMTHEFGHAIGLSHSAESGQATTPYTEEAMMYWMAHFDGRRNELKAYDRGAIAALYGPIGQPTRTPEPTIKPTPISTPTPSPTPIPTTTPTPIASITPTTTSPFYKILSLTMITKYGNASIQLTVENESIENTKPKLILYNNNTRKAILLDKITNVQLNKNQLTFHAYPIPYNFMTKNTTVAVVTGTRVALADLICERKLNTYNCK